MMQLFHFTEHLTLRQIYVAAPDVHTAHRYAITQGDFRTRKDCGDVSVITGGQRTVEAKEVTLVKRAEPAEASHAS